MKLFKKALGIAAVAGAGYVLYNEYQRRKEEGDEFVLKLDNQIHTLVDEVGAKIDSALATIESKLTKAEEGLAEEVELEGLVTEAE